MNPFGTLKKMKTLLIDDDEWIRDSLNLFFKNEGCHLLAVETAEDGIKALKKQDYDIVIADYKLPGMDGLEFLKWTLGNNPNAFTILITAYINDQVVSEAKRIGVMELIEKPFTSEMIQASLSRLIRDGKST